MVFTSGSSGNDVDLVSATYLVSNFESFSSESSSISWTEVKDDDFYDWYLLEYEKFHKAWPDLKWRVTANGYETMKESLDEGLLYYAYKDGQRLGLIAATRDEFLGHEGLYFNEILVESSWKGEGLAKLIQREFVKKVGKANSFIWGTIDSNNLPSLKTALSNGRRPIRYENFVNF